MNCLGGGSDSTRGGRLGFFRFLAVNVGQLFLNSFFVKILLFPNKRFQGGNWIANIQIKRASKIESRAIFCGSFLIDKFKIVVSLLIELILWFHFRVNTNF